MLIPLAIGLRASNTCWSVWHLVMCESSFLRIEYSAELLVEYSSTQLSRLMPEVAINYRVAQNKRTFGHQFCNTTTVLKSVEIMPCSRKWKKNPYQTRLQLAKLTSRMKIWGQIGIGISIFLIFFFIFKYQSSKIKLGLFRAPTRVNQVLGTALLTPHLLQFRVIHNNTQWTIKNVTFYFWL